MKNFSRPIAYILAFLIVFFFGWESATYYLLQKVPSSELQSQTSTPAGIFSSLIAPNRKDPADLSLYWKIWNDLFSTYVDESAFDKQNMLYGSIKGLVNSLEDPYTIFMTPNETKNFDESLNGTLEGIGAELTIKDRALVIISPLKNSPAERAGLMPGDIVYKINGNFTSEMTLFDAITKIRGPKGTNVTLVIVRKGKEKPFDVTITRQEINIESVSLEAKKDGIFYVAINQFSGNTKLEFDNAIQKIVLKEPKGVILDLRYNGGGYLDGSIDILSEFLKDKTHAVSIKKRNIKDNEILYTSGNPRLGNVPLVVLVNKGSASASEIVAGAVQDNKRGIIMGEQTFGKGSVQEVNKFSDGSSLRMTIAHWFTPKGQNINKVGITPDILVPLSEKDIEAHKDPQLDSAVKYLKNL